jgi:Fe-Mn family superoxide dismutase
MQYSAQKFALPVLDGLSQKQMEVHLGLYEGYVKNLNLLHEQAEALVKQDADKYAFAIESVRRRMGFEFDGMRMHEVYFEQWEHKATAEPAGSALDKALSKKYGSWKDFVAHFRKVGMSRGGGWVTLGWDAKAKTPHIWWTADHEIGMLAELKILLTCDMWEHAYMVDYLPSEKAKYLDAFFKNLNWDAVEKRFS